MPLIPVERAGLEDAAGAADLTRRTAARGLTATTGGATVMVATAAATRVMIAIVGGAAAEERGEETEETTEHGYNLRCVDYCCEAIGEDTGGQRGRRGSHMPF